MQAGKLRHRVALQQELRSDDGSAVSWPTIATLWASVVGVGGREFYQAKKLTPELTHQVTIRYRPGIVGGMRFVFGDAVLRIQSAVDPDGLRVELLVMCEELVQ